MIGMIGRQFGRLWRALRNAPDEREQHYDTWRELKERKKRLEERAKQHRSQRQSQPPRASGPET